MKVLLVCAAGMSTSMLMKKMEAYAKDNGIDLEIAARSFSELKNPADDGYDCILIGPQISYQKDKVVAKAQGLPVDVIPMKDYGRQNCPAIFEQIDKILA
ncbi:PTS sugar transporter subunit IIB [Collinsella tanakaei]|uniref:PTS sugar transporter subunit IIB n=1 Tax=Collinsella ihumii TaxID=1720204 RepID=A0ABT7XBU2_9ACTN|nr:MULTISPECIES: PTS sugar transporter subunit IIB [Collinsella]MBM6756251.1 PTS sugar transporter subunit IIB [Collinsella tanakaei]MBM6776463.1 PTS sugar transporter subunit IIB [Collinsella tanakaei]MBM6778499.1 PTS sugar transporter subunit IIB [Collinsella tanakaei]MBM6784813.1 PTS sugar transporter subunit IIB [Collinsella tanakaei]MBM6867105.1 PTS sugar transporter subunit IIB [Collinsella tanakaei]